MHGGNLHGVKKLHPAHKTRKIPADAKRKRYSTKTTENTWHSKKFPSKQSNSNPILPISTCATAKENRKSPTLNLKTSDSTSETTQLSPTPAAKAVRSCSNRAYFPTEALCPSMTAFENPHSSMRLRPLIVYPPGVVTLSISASG